MPLGFAIDQARLEDLCQRFHVARLELFGSRAQGIARPGSDVDLLVIFEEGQTPGLGFFALALELEALLGHGAVDLFTRASVERSPHLVKRQSILATTERLYERSA
jgi:predicted nucleotidyltransferase